MVTEPALAIALIGVLGIGAQWIAWRLAIPAIVLMLVAGLIGGPVTGLIDPETVFGDLFRPLISIAVAVILFEGGLTLNFKELRETGPAVKRLVYVGAPLGWILSTAAIHFGAGLSLESSAVFGGILIVTGPTVITPLLRQAKLAHRPAAILRWEAIVNDPVGALAAVLAFEVVATLAGAVTIADAAKHLAMGIIVAGIGGWIAGRFVVWSFLQGHVPEYMKVPVLFGTVLAIYSATDSVLHESGLLAVTVMGLVIGNANLPSFDELRRFKEHATVMLVSGVFIMLAASLDSSMLAALDARAAIFVALVVFFARPLTVLIALAGTDLSREERLLIGWIGPRGVVAVAVAGLFGQRLVEKGIADGAALAPLAFALVAATVVIHGFSLGPLARMLGLTSTQPPGALIAGVSNWSVSLAATLKEAGLPVRIADRNYFLLGTARLADIPTYHGEILSEAAEHSLPMSHYGTLIAATSNDDLNALICTSFGPEFGRLNVFQVGRHEAREGERDMPTTLGGRTFGSGAPFEDFADRYQDGWRFGVTTLTEEYGYGAYSEDRPKAEVIGVLKGGTDLRLTSDPASLEPKKGDVMLAFRKRDDVTT